MELHPTPESWRVALFTAFGALVIAAGGLWVAVEFAGSARLVTAGVLVVLAGLATFAPAIGALSATVDADARGVTIRRFGRESHYAWADIVDIRLAIRAANVPDGTQYHWVLPNRHTHIVAVPSLALADGGLREIPALAAPAMGPNRSPAAEYVELLARVRAAHTVPGAAQPAEDTNTSIRSQTKAMTSSSSA